MSTTETPPAVGAEHPCPYSRKVLVAIDEALDELAAEVEASAERPLRVLDPFAGIGTIHELARSYIDTIGVELQPAWAARHPGTICGDATDLHQFESESIDVVATSPTYGNRMADVYVDNTVRHTYTAAYGAPLEPNNSGALFFGPTYCRLHTSAWREVRRVLRPGGTLLLNVSDHIKDDNTVPVTAWHISVLTAFGFVIDRVDPINTPRQGHGQNHTQRVEAEYLIQLHKTR